MTKLAKVERKIEYLPCIGEIKEFDDKKGIVGGYANYINNIDFGDDRSKPGAFRKTIQDAYSRKAAQNLDYLYPYLWSHDFSQIPPGGVYAADEDRKGFYTKTQFNLDIESGRTLYSSFRGGFLKKQSIGYKALQYEFVKDEETKRTIRDLLEIQVMEISAVTFPMNDMAQVDTVKNGRRDFYMPGKLLTKQDTPATTKDYAASYAEVTPQDWRTNLWNLWYPLFNEFVIAQTGDTPVEDAKVAISQFTEAALAYMQRGVELKMTEYLQPDDDSEVKHLYMSADDNPETKAGRTISAANHAKIKTAADGIMKHAQDIHDVLRTASLAERQNTIAGTQLYGADDPVPEQKEEEKQPQQKEEPFVDIHTALHDLSLLLSADNANRGL